MLARNSNRSATRLACGLSAACTVIGANTSDGKLF